MLLLRPNAFQAYAISPIFKGPLARPVPPLLVKSAEEGEVISQRALAIYQKINEFDLYFGASLRGLNDFEAAANTIASLEKKLETPLGRPPLIAAPLLLTATNNREKGRLERLCLAKSRCVFIFDAEKDTRGKIMEDAIARLVYGLPVVLLIPEEKRFNIAREIHPLALVGTYEDAYGAHVMHDMDAAIQCLASEILGQNSYEIKEEGCWIQKLCILCGSILEETIKR